MARQLRDQQGRYERRRENEEVHRRVLNYESREGKKRVFDAKVSYAVEMFGQLATAAVLLCSGAGAIGIAFHVGFEAVEAGVPLAGPGVLLLWALIVSGLVTLMVGFAILRSTPAMERKHEATIRLIERGDS